jgi:hypothetical protein
VSISRGISNTEGEKTTATKSIHMYALGTSGSHDFVSGSVYKNSVTMNPLERKKGGMMSPRYLSVRALYGHTINHRDR